MWLSPFNVAIFREIRHKFNRSRSNARLPLTALGDQAIRNSVGIQLRDRLLDSAHMVLRAGFLQDSHHAHHRSRVVPGVSLNIYAIGIRLDLALTSELHVDRLADHSSHRGHLLAAGVVGVVADDEHRAGQHLSELVLGDLSRSCSSIYDLKMILRKPPVLFLVTSPNNTGRMPGYLKRR
jgi:hypothetical protein